MLWGIDISHHQGTVDMVRVKSDGYDFAFVKASEGASFVDPSFTANLRNARVAGLLIAAYHYQRADASANAQVARITALVPVDVPVILDVEADSGNLALTREIITTLRERSYKTPLLYLPRWYWQKLGSPSLAGLPPLWSSRYPDSGSGYASTIYARVPASYWDGYGGGTVSVLQFSASAMVAGRMPVDVNAYRGTRAELAAALTDQGRDDMFSDDDRGKLTRLAAVLPAIDEQAIASRKGHSPGSLTNAVCSSWEHVFWSLSPTVSTLAERVAKLDAKLDAVLAAVDKAE